jgi:hypothetical protein
MKRKRQMKLGANTGWINASELRPFVLRAQHRYGSLEKAASAAGVSIAWIYNIAGGKTKYARRDTAAKLLRALR